MRITNPRRTALSLASFARASASCPAAAGLALCLSACGSDGGKSNPSGPDAHISLADAGADKTDAMLPAEGDGNDDFAAAVEVTVDDTKGEAGAIEKAKDRDYFKFTAAKDDFVAIATAANPMDDPAKLDTVVTLYDSEMKQVAQNDDGVPRINTDSEIVYQIPTAGTYYAMVQEYSDWANEMPEGKPSFVYQLVVLKLTASRPGTILATESGNDAASATPLTFNTNGGGLILGGFDGAGDVDVYSTSVAGDGETIVSASFMPMGTKGYGSTASAGVVTITDMTGGTIFARIDVAADANQISPPLLAGSYLLWVKRASGAAGANDFYVVKIISGGQDNPLEKEPLGTTGANDSIAMADASAETITLMEENDGIFVGFILAHLPMGTDVDYFAIDAPEGVHMSANCGAASIGSGVMDLAVEIRDAADAVLNMADEDAVMGAQIEHTPIDAAGKVYLRLSASGVSDEVKSDYVRCGVFFQPAM